MNFINLLTEYPLTITEGSVIERLKRELNSELDPYIANAGHIYNSIQRQQLKNIYKQYIDITCAKDLPIVLFTPTWRASAERIRQTQLFDKDVNQDCFQFLNELRNEYKKCAEKIFIGGLIGCRGDAYKPEEELSTAKAEAFHSYQVERLANAGVDFLIAETLPAISEALGIAKAMAAFAKPYIIGFVIRDKGTLLDGTPLYKAISLIDHEVRQQPVGYVVNCVHPLIFRKAIIHPINTTLKLDRIIGLMGNTSAKSPEELDDAISLQAEDPEVWAENMLALHREFGIKILGGCCGTNNHHIDSLVKKFCLDNKAGGSQNG